MKKLICIRAFKVKQILEISSEVRRLNINFNYVKILFKVF